MTGLPVPIGELPDLVAQTREGSEAAFTMLVGKYQPLVFRWAVALSGDEDAAEDITQEVFVRVHRKLSSFRGDGPFEGWLYRITRRVARRTRQKTARQVTSTHDVYVTDPGARVDRQRAVELIQTIAKTLLHPYPSAVAVRGPGHRPERLEQKQQLVVAAFICVSASSASSCFSHRAQRAMA